MGKTKRILKNFKVILVMIAVLLALAAINPSPFAEGVAIRSVATNSSAAIAGIISPTSDVSPTSRERILTINNRPIATPNDYLSFESSLKANRTITIKTDQGFYRLLTKDKIETIILNETEEKEIIEEVFDEELNKTINKTTIIIVNKTLSRIVGVEPLGLSVYEAPKTNIRKGLDLEGGTRVLLQPEINLEDDDLDILIDNIKQRINVYGLSDIVVREAGDLSGNQYLLIEIPGAQEEEVKDLVSKQGKFEATIGNETVFKGGDDITYVCRSADCSGLDPFQRCGQISTGEWSCQFRFSISLRPLRPEPLFNAFVKAALH